MSPADSDVSMTARGLTPKEVAKLFRVNPEKIRQWVRAGELGAINVAAHQCGKPRLIILPEHLAEFAQRRSAGPPPKPARRRKRTQLVDFYPD